MLTKKDIELIINECRNTGENGLGNGCRASIPELNVDFLSPPTDFLGVGSNPAIFVNRSTYNLLGKHHKTWTINKTIAVKESFLEHAPINVIGIIVHEAGHAFNVAANIENSEANAYIFEIDTLTIWFKTKNPLLVNCSTADLQSFLESRLHYYEMAIKSSDYLAGLIKKISQNQMFDQQDSNPAPTEVLNVISPHKFVIQTPRLVDPNPTVFFKHIQSDLNTTSLCGESLIDLYEG